MQNGDADMNTNLMVDGNAVAGQLQQIFGRDLTVTLTRCSNCAAELLLGALMVFMRGPGAVLRCPACDNVIIRIVETPKEYYIEARGAVFMRFNRDREQKA
jgi:Family of unknown function (DUF6510)